MGSSHREEESLRLVYEASRSGSVSTLNSLLQKEPLILHKISQSGFTETPLHISALLGHLEFSKALVTYNPKLAIEIDSSQNTPLHLASAEGHVDIVKELLQVNNKPCLFPNEEGKIPLHHAVMRGRTEVVRELVRAKPESLSFLDNNGNNVFHLCVIYNHLETLKTLVKLELAISGNLLSFTSSDGVGNTIFHLAVTSKQVETIRYMLSIPKVMEMASLKNDMGFTAYDILKRSPKDFKTLKIQIMLMEYSGTTTENNGIFHDSTHSHSPSPPVARPQILEKKKKRNYLMMILGWFRHKGNWLEEMRETLSLVSTVIATITFQSLINPPGGFIQQQDSSGGSSITPLDCFNTNNGKLYCPGQALLSFNYEDQLLPFVICNTISFVSSLSVTLLLVSGFPMKNKAFIWLLSILMCITLTCLALAYVFAFSMIMPSHLWGDKPISNIIKASMLAWCGLLALIMVLITLRFIIWMVKKFGSAVKKQFTCGIWESR